MAPGGNMYKNVRAQVQKTLTDGGAKQGLVTLPGTSGSLEKITPEQQKAVGVISPNVGDSSTEDGTAPTSPLLSNPLTIGKSTNLSIEETLRYPTSIGEGSQTTKQDYIKFDVLEYGTKSIQNPLQGGIGTRTNTATKTSIILPMPGSINDENSVMWGGEDLNAINAWAANKSLATIESPGKAIAEFATSDITTLTTDPAYGNALKLYLAGQAASVNNLLGRSTGAIINPNLELLFQAPTLRPFTFNFRLSPRNLNEANVVKQIIRVFKEAGSVKTVDQGLFLKAPNVFRIKYIDGSTKTEHKSLNLIKECALTACRVNYTPENTYMTFNDPNHTMVSYELSLSFSELEPVTSADYASNTSHPIGY